MEMESYSKSKSFHYLQEHLWHLKDINLQKFDSKNKCIVGEKTEMYLIVGVALNLKKLKNLVIKLLIVYFEYQYKGTESRVRTKHLYQENLKIVSHPSALDNNDESSKNNYKRNTIVAHQNALKDKGSSSKNNYKFNKIGSHVNKPSSYRSKYSSKPNDYESSKRSRNILEEE